MIHQINTEKKQKILRERAFLLAKEKTESQLVGSGFEVLEFQIGSECYGIETCYISKVYPLKDLTPLPGVPSFVIGIINIRGHVLPVLDLKKIFDLPGEEPSEKHKVIIVSVNDSIFGILSEEARGLRFIPDRELQSSLPTLTGIRSDYLKGITYNQLVILDTVKLVSDKKIVIEDKS